MNRVRMAVVGCGGMGQGHIKSIKETTDAQLTAVSDVHEETARKIGTENNVPYFTDYRKMYAAGLCDAVVIATPHYFHHEAGIAAFKTGLHVLSEKPITVTVSAADEFIAAAKKHRRVFSVMYQMRCLPDIRAALEIIKSGGVGEIRRTMMLDPNYRPQAYYDSAGWRGTWIGEGGGVTMNQAPHGIDLFMLLAGRPAKVTAQTRTRMHKIEVEDEACAMLEYENGAYGYYYASTCEMPYYRMMEICGDKGKIVWREGDLKFCSFKPSISEHNRINTKMWAFPEVVEEKPALKKALTGHQAIIQNFCGAILRKEELIAPGAEGLWSVEFINSLILSGHQKKPVDLPLDREEYDAFLARMKKKSKAKKIVREQRVTDTRIK